jgi:hypothetical protein
MLPLRGSPLRLDALHRSTSPRGGGSWLGVMLSLGGGFVGLGQIPASLSHSTIFCLGMAPTFMEAIWPPLKSIMVGMPRTP